MNFWFKFFFFEFNWVYVKQKVELKKKASSIWLRKALVSWVLARSIQVLRKLLQNKQHLSSGSRTQALNICTTYNKNYHIPTTYPNKYLYLPKKRSALESGVTLFNTATFYGPLNEEGFGANLRLINHCMKSVADTYDRSKYQLMVKIGMDTKAPQADIGKRWCYCQVKKTGYVMTWIMH